MSISLLQHTPSFLGQFSHNRIIVAPSLSFLNVLKSCYLVFFSWRKTQDNKKKQDAFENLLPHISITEALSSHQQLVVLVSRGFIT
jgi:hypothetical protein